MNRWSYLAFFLLLACGSKTAFGGIDEPEDASVDSAMDSALDSGFDSAIDTAIDTRPACSIDDECDDGSFCNGREFCNMGGCAPGMPTECIPPPDGCTMGVCDEAIRDCFFSPIDRDGDLHLPTECGGDDCDDADPTIYGGAPELCDYLDNDCNLEVDEGLTYVGLGSGVEVSARINGAVRPDVVFDGSNYDVVFDSDMSVGQVYQATVRRNGRLRGSPSAVTFSAVLASSPDLTWTGSEYGLWHHFHLDEAFQGTVSLTRLSRDGSVIRRAVAATPDVPDADIPAAAWSGSDWGVAYFASLSSGRREIRFLRASMDGTVTVDPFALASAFDLPFVKPSIAWTGRRFAIAWGQGSRAHVVGLSRGGSAEAWTTELMAEDQSKTSLVWTTDELALVWTSTTRVDTVRLARLTDRGATRGRVIDLTPDSARQTAVDAIWSGRELAVIYQRSRTAMPGTFIVRVGDRARWVSLPGFVDDRVADVPGSAIASTDEEYGVAYPANAPRGGTIFFRRAGCE